MNVIYIILIYLLGYILAYYSGKKLFIRATGDYDNFSLKFNLIISSFICDIDFLSIGIIYLIICLRK